MWVGIGHSVVAISLAALLLPTEKCEAALTDCVVVANWNSLVAAVTAATDTLVLCPFEINKPSAARILVDKPLHLSCFRTSTSDRCSLNGPGNHVRIQGPRAALTLEGFSFYGATESAIRIAPTATKTHVLQECNFFENRGSFNGWRGGAIKTEQFTSLIVTSCTFTGNAAAEGGAIYHRGNLLSVDDTSFMENVAKRGGGINGDSLAFIEIQNSIFRDNIASEGLGGAVLVKDAITVKTMFNVVGTGNLPCNGIQEDSKYECEEFDKDDIDTSFVPGLLTGTNLGLKLSTGLKVTLIVKSGQRVQFTSTEATSAQSLIPFHLNPDGAGVFELDDGGWVYMSNAEGEAGGGGVYALEFDSLGRPRNYVARLKGTTRNCSGGKTPWNTWVSCEEYGKGKCWQVDPTGKQTPAVTDLVEKEGGNFESMAVDFRTPSNAQFFVTEDHSLGALRRFRPFDLTPAWDMLHHGGTIDYLQFLPNNKFLWTPSLDLGRKSASTYYPNVEGVSVDDGILSFISKKTKTIFSLDLDKYTYSMESTLTKSIQGGGSFEGQPDQIVQLADELYFTEDGGRSPGVFVHNGVGFYTLLEAYESRYSQDETTGLAFSPDGTKLYFCIQEIGYMFQAERLDGLPFNGRLLGFKPHAI